MPDQFTGFYVLCLKRLYINSCICVCLRNQTVFCIAFFVGKVNYFVCFCRNGGRFSTIPFDESAVFPFSGICFLYEQETILFFDPFNLTLLLGSDAIPRGLAVIPRMLLFVAIMLLEERLQYAILLKEMNAMFYAEFFPVGKFHSSS